MRCRTRHQDAAETRTALGGWRAGTRLASKGPSWSKEMCFWRPWGNRPWNMGAGAMTMSGQWQPRSGQLSAWSQRDVLVAGPPTQKKAPAVIFLSRLPPPRHYIPLIAHHLLTRSLADHLLCYIPSLTIESPLSRFPKTLAHHGQLSRAAQGHWHCKSFYPAKPLRCVELDGELQGARVVAILAGQTASRLAHMVVMALGHDANRALEI